jgi:hypothetical protein
MKHTSKELPSLTDSLIDLLSWKFRSEKLYLNPILMFLSCVVSANVAVKNESWQLIR